MAQPLRQRVADAAEAALAARHYVSMLDVLLRIRWLDAANLAMWRTERWPCLEAGMQVGPARVSEALELLRQWATNRGLEPSEAEYVARDVARTPLRFTHEAEAAREQAFRTHWISPALTSKARERLEAKVNRPPELVVIQPHDDWKCHRCGGTGDLLIMQPPGPACLSCAGLGELEFLPSGDAGLTRKAREASSLHAVVVRFSRARKRYERQGTLVEPAALRAARAAADSARRKPKIPSAEARGRDFNG